MKQLRPALAGRLLSNPYFEKRGMSLKIVGKLLALLAFCVSGTTFAQTAPASCTPYSIPIQSTVTDCGPGLIGSKFKTKTRICPGGEVVESKDFDTTACMAATTGGNGMMTYEARCRLTPGGCATAPIAANCPAGRKWSLKGTGVAHCVDEDPVCPWGTSLQHDNAGNPSCIQNTCPSNQVLQSDGKACGCPVGLVLEGATCVAPTPTCLEGSTVTSTEACQFGGTKYLRETTSCPAGPFGAPQKDSAWDQSSCAAPPPVTCTTSSYSESAACSAGTSGSQTRNVTISCPTGQYGSPSTNYGAWNTSECRATCTPTSSTYATSCGTGFSGTKYVTTNYTCPSGSTQSENTSGCGCANGANDYPTCTPPPPALPPKFSVYYWEETDRWEENDPYAYSSRFEDFTCPGGYEHFVYQSNGSYIPGDDVRRNKMFAPGGKCSCEEKNLGQPMEQAGMGGGSAWSIRSICTGY